MTRPHGSEHLHTTDPADRHSAPRNPGARHPHHPPDRAATAALALDVPGPSPAHPPAIPEERLDSDAVRIIARLRHVGHQAYFVGGCVRDLLLDHKPKDFDLATSAHPGEVRAVFRNCRLIGRRFRLAHVYFRGGKIIEVATFRKNPVDAADDLADPGDLLITRDNVFGTAEEDARRRDFTVNGLFYDPFAGEVIDYVGGRADLDARRIATIGEPEIRIQEDPVRSLRAIRFAARLGFSIEPETFAAMRRHSPELGRCAPARLLEETFKILRCGASARAFDLLRSSGTLPVLLPALAAFYDAADEASRSRFVAYLTALDRLVRGGAETSEAVLLGSLLLHLPEGDPGATGPREALLVDLVTTSRLPRRIAERTRLALSSQRALTGQVRRRRRGFSSQAYFEDALQLLEVAVSATGEGADHLARWRAEAPHAGVHREAGPGGHGREGARTRRGPRDGSARREPAATREPAGPPAAAPPEASGEAPRRRRRRGGRRRRRRGAGPKVAAQTGPSDG